MSEQDFWLAMKQLFESLNVKPPKEGAALNKCAPLVRTLLSKTNALIKQNNAYNQAYRALAKDMNQGREIMEHMAASKYLISDHTHLLLLQVGDYDE